MSKHSHPRRRKRRLLLLAAGLFLCAGFFYWGNHSLQVDIFTYTDPDLPAGFDGLKIVQLSDLHGAVFGDDNADLLSAVEAAEPDLIVLTGEADRRKTYAITDQGRQALRREYERLRRMVEDGKIMEEAET